MHSLKYGKPVEITNKADFETDITIGNEDVGGDATVTRILGFIKIGGNEVADNITYGSGDAPSSSGSFLSSLLMGPLMMLKSIDDSHIAKNAAALNACENSKSDVLMAPRYKVKTTNLFIVKFTNAEVVGRPGKINKINQIKTNK